jgi:hypothetical protein
VRAPCLATGLRRVLLLTALLCVLLARVVVPAGWMPMADAGGGFVLAPCSGMGMMAVAAPVVTHEPNMHMAAAHQGAEADGKRHPDPAGDHPCSGAGVTAALTTPIVGLPIAIALRPATFAPSVPLAFVGHGLAAPPPPSTGPPITA